MTDEERCSCLPTTEQMRKAMKELEAESWTEKLGYWSFDENGMA